MKRLQILLPIIFIMSINTLGYGQIDRDKSNYDLVIFRDDYPGYNQNASVATHTVLTNKKLLFENNQLRVSEINFQPGESKNIQPQAWPSFLYIHEDADFSDTSGTMVFNTKTLSKPLMYPANLYKEPDTLHQLTNLSTTKTLRLIRVEMKQ